jgi:hypothetical protein
MLARGLLRLEGLVHLHFHDWELVQRGRGLAIRALLQALRLRRRPLAIAELAELAADAEEMAWPGATIDA